MINKSGLLTKLVTTAIAGSFLFAATAFGEEAMSYSDDSNLNTWAHEASVLVSKNMKAPGLSLSGKSEGVTYLRVTIDEDGEVLKSSLIKSSGSNSLDRAASYSLKSIGNFPAIPLSQNASSMTFGVRMIYADSKGSLARINRELATRVRTEEVLASAGGVDVLALGND
jgi:TonB family protein